MSKEEKEVVEELAPEEVVAIESKDDSIEEMDGKDDAIRPEYVDKLKNEAIKWRKKAKATLKEKEELAEGLTAAESKAQEALTRIEQINKQTDDRLVNAELRAAATNVGLIDMDCASLADLTGVQVHENGVVTGVSEALKMLKESKPYLFSAATTAQPFPSPRAVSTLKTKRAIEMDDKDAEKAEKEYLASLTRR